ncbi:MAG: hypothetical protein ACRDBG_15430 [Waterburya sp.]
MPYMTNGRRDYKKERARYEKKNPEREKQRTGLKRLNRELQKDGIGSKGDGKDVSHIKATSKGGKMTRSNVRLQKASQNRSFARTRSGKMK